RPFAWFIQAAQAHRRFRVHIRVAPGQRGDFRLISLAEVPQDERQFWEGSGDIAKVAWSSPMSPATGREAAGIARLGQDRQSQRLRHGVDRLVVAMVPSEAMWAG